MKTALLNALSEAGGGILAPVLPANLGLSPEAAAAWVDALRLDGYIIDGDPQIGYRLRGRPDRLLPTEIQPGLKTERFGHNIVHFLTTTSTNDVAKTLAREGAADGTVVAAEAQTGGRGRRGRVWASPGGVGIWMSLILRPALAPVSVPTVTLTAAVGVTRAIKTVTGLAARIKWPNDILVEGKKVCGILTEGSVTGEKLDYAIVGIGINVNTGAAQFPEELRGAATSLRLARGDAVSRVSLVREILRELEELYRTLERQGFAAIREEWCRNAAFLGQMVRVAGPGGEYTGRAAIIDDSGALLVETGAGTVRVNAGDVSLRTVLP